MAFVRIMAMVLLALSVVFVCLHLYARAAQRERLEAEWDRNKGPGRKESFVAAELASYERPLRRRLIWGVYVVPGALIAALIYLTSAG